MEVNPNQKSTGVDTATNALGNIQRPGEYLRQIRLSKKIELGDVAKALHIAEKVLQAMEKDDYSTLPEATFIKGYYRNYAKYLNVDATPLIQRFDEIYVNDTGLPPQHALDQSPIKMMGKLPGSNHDRNKKWLKRIGIAAVIIIVLTIIVMSLQNSSKTPSDNEVEAGSEVQVLAVNGANTVGDQLKLEFTRPTSVQISDAKGNVLASGRQAATLELTGEAPFQIRLDDASAVSLSLNNENVALSRYTVNGKAEFRLTN